MPFRRTGGHSWPSICKGLRAVLDRLVNTQGSFYTANRAGIDVNDRSGPAQVTRLRFIRLFCLHFTDDFESTSAISVL